MKVSSHSTPVLPVIVLFLFLMPGIAKAHCDTMDGPVVATAKAALEKGDVTPVLKWVKKGTKTRSGTFSKRPSSSGAKVRTLRNLLTGIFSRPWSGSTGQGRELRIPG